jgi:hypothetical protein
LVPDITNVVVPKVEAGKARYLTHRVKVTPASTGIDVDKLYVITFANPPLIGFLIITSCPYFPDPYATAPVTVVELTDPI